MVKNNLPIIVNRAKEKNITSILSINTKLEEFNDHLNLIENYDSIFISCGVHPENITENKSVVSRANFFISTPLLR